MSPIHWTWTMGSAVFGPRDTEYTVPGSQGFGEWRQPFALWYHCLCLSKYALLTKGQVLFEASKGTWEDNSICFSAPGSP